MQITTSYWVVLLSLKRDYSCVILLGSSSRSLEKHLVSLQPMNIILKLMVSLQNRQPNGSADNKKIKEPTNREKDRELKNGGIKEKGKWLRNNDVRERGIAGWQHLLLVADSVTLVPVPVSMFTMNQLA